MHLPWKKSGISRISRFMADLQPPKPCSSMVVQTGFPTSLVDLFVKHSDRLKKPMKKMRSKHHHHTSAVYDLSISDPVLCPDLPGDDPVNFKIKDNLDVGRCKINHKSDEGLNGGGCNIRGDQRGVLYAVFMVFVLVILALISIKILTLGITMSACLLIFVDYIGKRIFQLPFSLLVCNFLRCKAAFWVFLCNEDKSQLVTETKEGEKDEQEEGQGEGEDSIELNSPAQEIQVIESRFDSVARAEPDNHGTGLNLMSGRWGYSEEDESEVIVKPRKLSRRSSREFIKKLVPKKWRAMKNSRKGMETTTEEYSGSDFSMSSQSSRNEEIEELYNSDSIEESKVSDSSTESESVIEKQYKEEALIKKESKGGGCAFLFLVALAGLVGGRVLALALTVAACLIIQLVRRARKQCLKNTL